jgi:molybdopterin synthase sulfur carrier subunit
MLKIVYFASLKDRIGRSEESIDLPEGISTVDSLIDHLSILHGEEWSSTINGSTVLVAVNHEMSDRSAPIKEGDEVAFFPPVTGG